MVQLMQMSERLDDAEGSSESKSEMNKKRDAELAKLRKLLEDVHLESEENAHHLRTKHQAAIAEMQDQVDQLQKQKSKAEKEKSKFQAEVFELMSQLEQANRDKVAVQKIAEKHEQTIYDLNIKAEEVNRQVIEVTAQRQRLAQENVELIKEVHDYKISLDNANHLKSQLASQLEDSRRRLEEEERKRASVENHCHTLEIEAESLKTQIEEESEAKVEAERQLAKANGDCASWKSKYDAEVQSHADDVDDLKRKAAQRMQEYEEQLEGLINKCGSLEKQKSRLQSEVEVLIMDLEKATTHAQNLEKRCGQLEKVNADLRAKCEEITMLMENAQREARAKAAELQKLQHEHEKLKDAKAALERDVRKLQDDLNEAKSQLGDAIRKCHEQELEIKRLENERDELAIAYREAETLRKQEEAKNQRLTAEIAAIRHDYEKRLQQKEDELEALRKATAMEIEQLNMRLAEAEAKLKAEVARIKKKMQAQITELEMTLDVVNKQNIDLQKTIKRQGLQITELQAHYDEVNRQLNQAVDALNVAQRRAQQLQAELEEMRVNCDSALRAKRVAEQAAEEAAQKVNELQTINVNLTAAKNKLEGEFATLSNDYEEVSKELRFADEKVQKLTIENKSVKDLLTEEQERLNKLDSIKKGLEQEVRNLQARLEEVEANALAGGKRVIAKLESRIRDVEIELEEERRRHAESQKTLRKKDARCKELLVQCEEEHKNFTLAQEAADKALEKLKVYKRQLAEQEGLTAQNLTRVRRFQRELEAAEDRADQAESNLNFIRAKHRSWVTAANPQQQSNQRSAFLNEDQ